MSDEARTSEEFAGRAYAPPTTSTFPSGSTEQGLKEIRTRLLDLTNRNKLLNFRFPASSCLRFVDVNGEAAFVRIVDGGKLSVSAVPEPQLDKNAEKPTAQVYAKEIGWNTSYDLEGTTSADDYGADLPVLHYAEHLNTLSRKIDEAARTAIEESGTNMLYLSFGFLEWYESDDSDEQRFAPLVSVPVTIDRTPGKGKAFRCELEYSGEDFDTNLSLVEKMRRDMGLEIPMLGEDESPEQYFQRFSDLLGIKKRWRIRRQMTLSLLDFGKLLMFRDLDPKNWPADDSISNHQLVRELFEGAQTTEIVRGEEFLIDDPALQAEVPALICDADSSQHSALIDALRGRNLVIEGPPGTGKSQTISNLIAEALAKGKTVLFVSDKLAALQVVRDRLEERGMGAFCLELHSHRTQKGALLKDVGRRIELSGSFSDPAELDGLLSVAENRKARLIKYVSLIKETVSPIQRTVFDILWAREAAYQALPFNERLVSGVASSSLLEYTQAKLAEAKDWLAIYTRSLSDILVGYESLGQHPWSWVQKGLSYADEQSCFAILPEIVEAIDNADQITRTLNDIQFQALDESTVGGAVWTIENVRCVLELFRILDTIPSGALDLRSASLESKESIEHLRETANEARQLQSQGAKLAAQFDLKVSPSELIQHATVVEQTAWPARWFSGDYRKAVRAYRSMVLDHKRAPRTEMSEGFRSVASFVSRRLGFDKNQAHRDAIGVGFIGVESNWDALLRLADWYEMILSALPGDAPVAGAFRGALFSENTARMKELKARLPSLLGHRAKLGSVVEHSSDAASVLDAISRVNGDVPMSAVLLTFGRVNRLIENAFREVATAYESADANAEPIDRAVRLTEMFSGRNDSMLAVELLLSTETERQLADARARLADLVAAIQGIAGLAAKLGARPRFSI